MSFEWLDLLGSTSRFRSAGQSAPSATSPRESSVLSGCCSMWTASARRFGDRRRRRRTSQHLCLELFCLELQTRFTLAADFFFNGTRTTESYTLSLVKIM